MNKKILAIIGIVAITAAVFAGCSNKDDAVDATASTDTTSQIAVLEESTKSEESKTTADSSSDNSAAENTTAKKENNSTSAKADAGNTTTAAKTTARQTTKAASQTAKATTKATTKTTTKTTTKATTTVKNVSAKDVQAQVNSYIRSKGITVDSSLNTGNSGWNAPIAGEQVDLNNGYTLKECKYYVDSYIRNMGTDLSMYCYYIGSDFYVCYM